MPYQQVILSRAPLGRCALFAALLALFGTLGGAVSAQDVAMPEVHVGMGLPWANIVTYAKFNRDLLEESRKAMAAGGYKLVGQMLPQTRALAMLRAGQLDGMLSTAEGIGGHLYFSDTYIVYQNVATTLTSRNLNLRQIEDLANYSVAAFQSANLLLGERFARVASNHADYREVSSQITQNKLLFMGRVDVVVGDRLIFRYFIDKLEPQIDATQAVTYHNIFPESPRKAAFREARVRDAFNAGLSIIRSNGTYDAIVKQYLGARK